MARKTKIKIDDRVWQDLKKKLKNVDGFVKVGVLQSSGHAPDGTSMVEIATIHEYGAPKAGIPERSFLRRTFDDKRDELAKITKQLAVKLIDNRSFTMKVALGQLGAWGATQVKNTIAKGGHIPPPLKKATIKAKGSTRPLVDTGRLVNSITHEVVTK
jgi:phage gpG-like protein